MAWAASSEVEAVATGLVVGDAEGGATVGPELGVAPEPDDAPALVLAVALAPATGVATCVLHAVGVGALRAGGAVGLAVGRGVGLAVGAWVGSGLSNGELVGGDLSPSGDEPPSLKAQS